MPDDPGIRSQEADALAADAAPAPDIGALVPAEPRSQLWIEVIVVLLLVWAPSLFNAAASRIWFSEMPRPSIAYDMLALIVQGVQVSAPVAYFMWRSGRPWSHFGIVTVQPWKDLGLSLLILTMLTLTWIGFWIAAGPIADELRETELPGDNLNVPIRGPDFWLLMAGCAAVGLSEELTMRGYLVPRLEQLLGSSAKAVLVSSLLFASYHLYQGIAQVVNVWLFGMVFGLWFCVLRRLWPIALAHALWDIAAFLWM